MVMCLYLQLERVRYILCSYLRTRLKKVRYLAVASNSCTFPSLGPQIEKYVVHILEAEASRDSHPLLSPEELAYAKAYADSLDLHFNTLLLRHMPQNCQKLDREKAGKE